MLQSCPVGHLLVNTTIDLQLCLECDPGLYTLDIFSGCKDGICSDRACQECPVGVDCARGLNPPWMHFVPKVLKIGLYPSKRSFACASLYLSMTSLKCIYGLHQTDSTSPGKGRRL